MDNDSLDHQDNESMRQLAAGHDGALNDLIVRHGEGIFHFLYRMLGNEEDAQDLAQEAFVRVYQNRTRFDERARFTTWLYTIAANLARNHHRWRSRHPEVSLDTPIDSTGQSHGDLMPDPQEDSNETLLAEERAEAVRKAVSQLPREMREAIILCEWEEMKVAEAAAVLKSTPKAVESRLHRARQMLRGKLKNWI